MVASSSGYNMTNFYTVGILNVDRPNRELRVWVCRIYDDMELPDTYSFFAGILYTLFEDVGKGNVQYNRMSFASSEESFGTPPLLQQPTATAHAAVKAEKQQAQQQDGRADGDDDDDDDEDSYLDVSEFLGFEYESPDDPSPFIEYVEMIRWCDGGGGCGPSHLYDLQAEYLVKLTHDKYLSDQADPCFLGKYFCSTCHTDMDVSDVNPSIPYGLKQDTPIYPPEDFKIYNTQVTNCRNYLSQHLMTLSQLLDEAVPKLVAKDPIEFTPEIFPRLRQDIQQQIMCVLAFARRRPPLSRPPSSPPPKEESRQRRASKRLKNRREQQQAPTTSINPFSLIQDKSIFWHIFSFLTLVDQQRLNDVKEVYMAFKYGATRHGQQQRILPDDVFHIDYDLVDYEDQTAMKHYSMCQIILLISNKCREKEYVIKHRMTVGEEQEHEAQVYLDELKHIVKAIELYGGGGSTTTATTFNTDDTTTNIPKSTTTLTIDGMMDRRLTPFPKHPLEWILERVESASRYNGDDNIREIIDHVFTINTNRDIID